MKISFYSVPAWALVEGKDNTAERLLPQRYDDNVAQQALKDIEYRGYKAWDRAVQLTEHQTPAVYAKSPADLPALLRTADQLIVRVRVDAGDEHHTLENQTRIGLARFFREAMARGWPVLVARS